MILIAVSGGIDSMCLAEKARLGGGPFAIAHCNFGLRGAESDGDEAFVREWASANGITCHVKRFETEDYAREHGISIEMAARELRYRWFGELCRENGYEALAVAHNANDNAETLMLNLLRGTGLRGITGMRPYGTIPVPEYADIPLIRPLLSNTREELEAFASEAGLSWREDSTNAENGFKRNKIRNQVFPLFAEINPSFVQTLNRDMLRISQEMAELLRPSEEEHHCCHGGGHEGGCGGHGEGGCCHHHDEGPAQKVYTMSEEPWDGSEPVKQPEGELILDADRAGAFEESRWQSGDWIKPLGAPGKKKLQDWFTDHHIPADDKTFIPLLRSADDPSHILAIVPYCIDNSVRVTASTRRIIRIRPQIEEK